MLGADGPPQQLRMLHLITSPDARSYCKDKHPAGDPISKMPRSNETWVRSASLVSGALVGNRRLGRRTMPVSGQASAV